MTNISNSNSNNTSGSLQSIERTATIAWCPTPNASGQPLLASGTVAGALDSSFSSSCHLEVFELSLDGHKTQRSLVSLPAPTRFHKLGWSGHKEGCIVGAMEDGSVGFWNAGRILGGAPNTPAIIKKDVHSGPVRGLSVNPTNSFLVATGSADAEVFIWDLNEFKSMLPGNSKSGRLTQVTDLAWNRQHPFILASSSSNGCTTIWDLRHRREIVQLAGKSSVSAICWSPDEATSIVTASDDNSAPVISMWDLRNANAPDKVLSGAHEKGILSLAWCPQDSDLLLSSGKDNRIVYWNPKTCTQLGYAEPSTNWIYDLSWWPRNPDLFAAASFDGHVNVYSFQSLSSTPNLASNELFGSSATTASTQDTAVKQIPKWLKRPVTASFGFGGKLFTASGRKAGVIAGAGDLGLDNAITSQQLSEYCAERAIKDPKAAHFWDSMAAVTVADGDYRKSLLKMFGITLEDHSVTSPQAEPLTASTAGPKSAHSNANEEIEQLSASMAAHSPFDFSHPTGDNNNFDSFVSSATSEEPPRQLRRRSTFCGEAFHLYPKEATQEERDITRAIIAGRYSEAVDMCVRTDRLSDALLVAVCGGPQLVAKTQRLYFQRVKCPYLRVVSGIVKKDLGDVVENADLADWKDVLALICAKAEASEFELLCSHLADRLATGQNGDEQGAVLCYVLGGHALKAAALLLKSAKRMMTEVQGSAVLYTAWLESLVDRVRTAHYIASRHAQRPISLGELVEQVPELYRYFLLYSFVLEERGCAGSAAEILGMIGLRTTGGSGAFQEALSAFGHRLGQLTGIQQLTSSQLPFELVDVQSEPVIATNEYQHQQQQPVNNNNYYAQLATTTNSQYYPSMQAQPAYPAYQQPPSNTNYGYAAPAQTQTYAQQPSSQYAPSQYATPQQTSQYATAQYAPPQPTSQYAQPPQATQYAPPQPTSQYSQPQSTPQYAQPQPASQYAQPQASPQYAQPQASQYYSPPIQQNVSQQPQTAPGYAPPSFEVPKPSIPVPIAISPSPSAPMMNNPALPNTAPINAPGVTTGAFNDAPIVQPKIQKQAAPIVSPVRPTIPSAIPPVAAIPSTTAIPSATAPIPPYNNQPQGQPQTSAPPAKPNTPIDPSKIAPNLMPIYQAFNALIGFCLKNSTPVQKRVVDDSIKRLQSLIAQLYRQELSAPVISGLQQIAQQLQGRQYDAAAAVCQQLMTNNFNEVGPWIVAARRLIDMAKTFPVQ